MATSLLQVSPSNQKPTCLPIWAAPQLKFHRHKHPNPRPLSEEEVFMKLLLALKIIAKYTSADKIG